MTSGLKTLHAIDSAITKARKAVGEASALPRQASNALADVHRRQAAAYEQIASDRLALIDEGEGGALGYVDRQAEKLLTAHEAEEARIEAKIEESLKAIQSLEADRRKQETAVSKAVDAYDKAAAAAETKLLQDAGYEAQLTQVETVESTVIRAEEKLGLAKEDEQEKGQPYRNDPFFAYLQKRRYGTKNAKGWFLTKVLDGWVARISNYRQAAENYRRLTAIPVRLEAHVSALEAHVIHEQEALQALENDMLTREGVTEKHEQSIAAQKKLDAIDVDLAAAEDAHQALRDEQAELARGDSGPYREAITMLSGALERKDLPSLRRLAAQTETRGDDEAIEELRELSRMGRDLRDDRSEAQVLLKKYQNALGELEQVRRRFKSSRYDAPSSEFKRGDLIGALLLQVLSGVLSGNDFWRQLQRNQRTNRRYSDNDFGGIDWTEGLRLPRSRGRRSGGWGGSFPTGGWGGGSWPSGGGRRRTSIPRMPRHSLPKIKLPRSRGGGFRTGGGF